MTDAFGELELKKTSGPEAGIQQWADVFYGVLLAPKQTMTVLADDCQYKSDGMAFVFAAFTVMTSSLTAIIGSCGGDMSTLSQLCIVAVMFVGVSTWTFLSLLLFLLARIAGSPNRNLGSSFIVTGWAFLPFYFINPAKCLLNVPLLGWLVVSALIVWMIYLEYAAFKAVLGFKRKRMIALMIGVPIMYKLSILCGLIFFLTIIF